MTVIKDRRHEPANDKFGTDKQRFVDRYMDRVRKAIQDDIAQKGLTDIGKGGIRVPIPKESTHEPIFHHTGGDIREIVYPGNKLDVGDQILKPKGGGGGGGGPGDGAGQGQGQDTYIWVNEEDYLQILFEGRTLPDMTKLNANKAKIIDREHAGYSNLGPDHRLDADKTEKKRKDDSMILAKGAEKRIFENLSEQFNILAQYAQDIPAIALEGKTKTDKKELILKAAHSVLGETSPLALAAASAGSAPEPLVAALQESVAQLGSSFKSRITPEEAQRLNVLEARLIEQFKSQSKIDRLQEDHMVFEYDDDKPRPNAKAVMFCKMDVSYSMSQERKNTAKVFYWLLNKFLRETYEEVDIVFIAHTDEAKEVSEKDFFYGKDSGGTLVSSCHEKELEIIAQRYGGGDWNIYSAQASDGDTSYEDNERMPGLMDKLLPLLQAHYYIEIGNHKGYESAMFRMYKNISAKHNGKLQVAGGLQSPADSLDAFKKFFPIGGHKTAPGSSPSLG